MGEKYIRHINLSLERYDDSFDVESKSSADRRGLVNETAFLYFSNAINLGLKSCVFNETFKKDIKSFEKKAKNKIALIEKKDIKLYKKLNVKEIEEVYELITSLFTYILSWPSNSDLVIFPEFYGCGLVEACNGDVLINDTLCEMKAGDRKFRSIDIRQVLIYVVLNKSFKKHEINKISLVNPRHHIYYEVDVEEAFFAMSGLDANTCASEVINFLSGIGMSK